MSFFLKSDNFVKTLPIGKLDRITYAIDTSGSTGGGVLRNERESAKVFFALLTGGKKNFQALQWNSYAQEIYLLDSLNNSSGGTTPSCIVPFVTKYAPQLLILYTDGECDDGECKRLSASMMQNNLKTPLIVVFTLSESLQRLDTTIQQIETKVNMSIPNGLMSVCSDVCIIININSQEHRLLMASGSFANVFKPITLQNGTTLRQLPLFDFALLLKVDIIEQSSLPPGCLMLNGFPHPLVLHLFYDALITCEDVSVDLIKAISDRMLLPRLDLDRLHDSCVRFLSANAYENDPAYKAAAERLMRVAAASNKSEEHVACRQELEIIKARYKSSESLEMRPKRAAVQSLLQLIADYRANSNQFVLGSNRANRAALITVSDAQKLRECLVTPAANILTIEECPVFMESGNACILLSSQLHAAISAPPKKEAIVPAPPAAPSSSCSFSSSSSSSKAEESLTKLDAELLLRFTNDFNINSPFHLGASTMIVTPRIFAAQFGLDCARNPFSDQHICARIVLDKDIHSLMRQLCRQFCASRQMWHMVIAFASMLAKHLLNDAWAEHAVLVPYFLWLIDVIQTTRDFSDDSLLQPAVAQAQRVSLRRAIDFVMTDYAVHLRNRLPSDSRAMLNIPLVVARWTYDSTLPALQTKIAKVGGMLSVMETFAKLLDEYKKGTDMIDYIMERDAEYQHCVAPRKGISAIIGMVFFLDSLPRNPSKNKYMNLAFQDALDLALTKAKQSSERSVSALYDAFVGDNVDDVAPLRLPVVPTSNMHFGQENFERSIIVDGQHHVVCAYCGFSRRVDQDWEHSSALDQQARSDMREHFLRNFTPEFYYNGFRCVKEACAELGTNVDEKALFIRAKNKLYAKHGANFWCLHTADTKNQLLYFIRLRKWEAKPEGPKPIKQ